MVVHASNDHLLPPFQFWNEGFDLSGRWNLFSEKPWSYFSEKLHFYQRGDEFEELYQVAERLLDLDHRLTLWRVHHFKVVRRVIGGGVVGTAGTPVEVLGKLIHKQRFSPLWMVRDELTEIAKTGE